MTSSGQTKTNNQEAPSVSESRSYSIAGTDFKVSAAAPGLHVVATPIGNLGDISIRALETLAGVDVIACEDTRVTRRLLERYGLKTPLIAYHDRNGPKVRPKVLARLQEGGRVALVSDAGTPLVSDPGFKLVREASAAGYDIIALPGASSVLGALVASALPTDRFLFEGFLPNKSGKRKTVLQSLAGVDATLVFFESARRLPATLQDMREELGNRDAAVIRELTKKFEECVRLPLAELAAHYEGAPTPKGEIVIIVAPPGDQIADAQSVEDLLLDALARLSVGDAAREVAKIVKLPKREIYARALNLSKPDSGQGE